MRMLERFTIRSLEVILWRAGVWRADIYEYTGTGLVEVCIPKGCKNQYRLERDLRRKKPVCLEVKVIGQEKDWLRNRKKWTYDVTIVLPGEIREIDVPITFSMEAPTP